MKVVRHNAASDFLDRAGAWLETAEAENNLILGIAAYFKSYVGQLSVEPYFLTLEDSGAIVGAALMTPPRRLLITTMPDTAVTTLADFMLAETVTVPGALGPKSETRLFADYWTSRTGRLCHARMSERIYTCESVAPLKHAPGRLRPATNDDQPLLSQWCIQFCLDARIEDETVYFKARLPSKIADGSLFIWENDEACCHGGSRARDSPRHRDFVGVYARPFAPARLCNCLRRGTDPTHARQWQVILLPLHRSRQPDLE